MVVHKGYGHIKIINYQNSDFEGGEGGQNYQIEFSRYEILGLKWLEKIKF